MNLLKLNALDSNDLDVFSAQLQDAVIKLSDMRYLEQDKQFVMVVNRFDWKDALTPQRRKKSYTRHRSGIQFARVLSVAQSGINQSDDDTILDLLAIEFKPTEAPSGIITLLFAGNVAVRLEVECIDVRLSDLGAAWETRNLPDHEKQ